MEDVGRRRKNFGSARLDVAILIICLGLVASVAVPRQVRLAGDARRGEVTALARSADSAAALAHSLWQSEGRPAALPGSRGLVAMVNGYPSIATLPLMLDEPEMAAFGYAGGKWQHHEIPADQPCGVAYTPPQNLAAEPVISARLAGC